MSLARQMAGALAKRRTPEFKYSALEKPTSIRVVILSPKTEDYLVHLTLVEVDLSTNPSYEALSYTWAIDSDISGPVTGAPSRTVICNGATLDVFKNLHNALVQLQELGWTSKPIWIDAICINQRDDAEKGVQVSMMGDIFRAASRVVVWLGKSSYATDIALRKADPFFTDGNIPMDRSSAWVALSTTSATLIAFEALSWVLSRSWFGRVWTLQETALARKKVYLLGSQKVPFDKFLLIEALEQGAFDTAMLDTALMAMDRMMKRLRSRVAGLIFAHNARKLLASGRGVTLETAVTEARNRRSVDARDKLFGVLSLCDPEDASGLAVDYQKSVQQVFYECAVALLRSKHTGLSLLSLVGQIRHGCDFAYAFHSAYIKLFKPDTGFVTDLPSWVPDLSAPVRPIPLRDLSAPKFSASGSVEPSFAINGRVMELKAAVLDTIAATGDCLADRIIKSLWRFLRLPLKLPRHSEGIYLPTGEPIVTALWRTLVAGTTHVPPDNAEEDAAEEQEVELTDRHFVEWFAIFAEQNLGWHTVTIMRDRILKEHDDNDLDFNAEPSDRRPYNNSLENCLDKEMYKLDRYKIQTIRGFLALFDSPAYGFREAIRLRNERFKEMGMIDAGAEQSRITGEWPLFENVFEKFYTDRRMFTTEKGYLETAPWTAVEGDVVMLVAGASVPYIFRPSERIKGGWELVGEAYCHGFMFGEGTKIKGVDFDTINVV